MEQYHWDTVAAAALPPAEATKTIRKLRWIGLETAARQVQQNARPYREQMGPEQAGVLAEIPYETD